MTNMPEAKLAREAEICYATVAHGHRLRLLAPGSRRGHGRGYRATLQENAAAARRLVAALGEALAARREPCAAGCDRALENAVITAPEARDPSMVKRLDAVAGRVLS